MRAGLASVLDVGEFGPVDLAVSHYLEEWQRGRPDLETYWRRLVGEAGNGAGPTSMLAALVKVDLQCRHERGERPTAAEYIDRFPPLRTNAERVLSLVYEEYCLLEERGERPDPEQFCARYEPWKDSLASQLQYHRVISQVVGAPPPPRFPEVGEHFEEFLILGVIGLGGAARVYLARDESLGNREVVLKVSADRGSEPSILGRLEHPNIVTVHSVVYQTATDLRGLCMPYRPGLPLDEVIRRVNPASRPRSARALRDALTRPANGDIPSQRLAATGNDESAAAESPAEAMPEAGSQAQAQQIPQPLPEPGWESFPSRGTHADAVAWVGATLARALHHAHSVGVYHRDVKPANVLLTYREGPQLLDFNLAHDPSSAAQVEAALRGGTLPYMAPEQLGAFLDPTRWESVGVGADIYSLGLVLREMLTGQPPATLDPNMSTQRAVRLLIDRRKELRTDLRVLNRSIPHALEAIVARCLAADPVDRYASAGELAEDLDQFLERGPLRHAPNPSRRERLSNWTRRNRVLRNVYGIAAALASIVVGALVAREAWDQTRPPTERSEFVRVAGEVEAENYGAALRQLPRWIEEEPGSPLLGFYYAAALFYAHRPDEAEPWLERVWRVPECEQVLTRWGRVHREFAGLAEEIGITESERSKNAAPERKTRGLELAERTLRLALAIDPTIARGWEGLVIVSERRGDFQTAIATLNDAIDRPDGAASLKGQDGKDPLPTFYHLRARIGSKWAQSLIASNDPPRDLLARAEGQLERSVAELKRLLERSDAALKRLLERSDAADASERFKIEFLLCETKLALGDVATAFGRPADARARFNESALLLQRLAPLGKGKDYYEELRERVEKRLGAGAGSSVKPDPASPPGVDRSGCHAADRWRSDHARSG